jgi:hypothetical protein
LGVPPGFDPRNLGRVGWGIIWPPTPLTASEEAHRSLLAELIAHRGKEMGGAPPQFHYRENSDYDDFLWEEGRSIEPGDMKPGVVPYYLLIAGPPSRIPWEFQQYLDAEYAVGRLWFDDPEDCKRYIQSLLDYERGAVRPATGRDLLFVGAAHEENRATQNSANHLVLPLSEHLLEEQQAGRLAANIAVLLGNRPAGGAYKADLLNALWQADQPLGARRIPSLFFFAGHGLEFETPSPEQVLKQGALICQDWPNWLAPPRPAHYLAAEDLSPARDLAGLVAFSFACYSAGTPRLADWQRPSLFRSPKKIAEAPFVARLPQKMLAGGALAFIGHVSKAWESSFLGVSGSHAQLGGFTSTIDELLRGSRIGHATDYMNTRWLHMTSQLERWVTGKKRSKPETIALWQARNDIRGLAILGDPAARMQPALLR